ncbi:MAG: hypothetical protein N0A16_07685 [Blastocatellia bacterium]|nr:hypothetical protein [Blastocatellia bacterium]MCS7157594.1 hypothetical protein [Blastocatellia bacterium]MCX7751859.1 hypothetical protein [Blastocatellia bacterium]MDW8166965.1 hypothetical protein [Acidobacteriota bacterium]MDW8257069.1 hypothetical protein [Acidobacteriota bacterium]
MTRRREIWRKGAAAGLAVLWFTVALPIAAQQREQVIVQGDITSNRTWTPDKEYILSGAVFVRAGATLTILPGTVIKGLDRSFLVIDRGAKLIAEGTPSSPIVFTSAQPRRQRSPRDWGGVWINGRAPINAPGGEEQGEAGLTGVYGGNDPNDSSGVIRYVRIEFAGFPVAPDRELNNFTLAGVGAGTIVDHVHVNRGADDGIEFFGGTVNVKYVLVTGPGDDGFDWQTGWTGKAQFVVVQQDGEVDPAADRGIEADNNENDNNLLPRSNPTIYNVTLVGDPRPQTGGGAGIVLRRGTAGTLRNLIVVGFKRAGLDIQGSISQTLAQRGELVVSHAIFFENGPNFASGATSSLVSNFAHIVTADPKLRDPFNLDDPDFRPADDSPALDRARVASPPNDGFFEPVYFLGGVNPQNDWTKAKWIVIARD